MISAGFISYLIYLSSFIGSLTFAAILIWKRDFETLAVPVILFFLCMIGLFTTWPAFLRSFAALYGIEFSG